MDGSEADTAGNDLDQQPMSSEEEAGETTANMDMETASDVNVHLPPKKKQKRQHKHYPSLPNKVTFDPARKLFRVRKAKGKTLAAGGFGVSVRVSPEEANEEDKQKGSGDDNGKANIDDGNGEGTSLNGNNLLDENNKPQPVIRREFLFVEEVIFLYERGLMDVYDENSIRLNDTPHRIYDLLEPLGLSLPLYLVYAHFRQQSYRVVRHGTARRQILDEMEKRKQECTESTEATTLPRASSSSTKTTVEDPLPVELVADGACAMKVEADASCSQDSTTLDRPHDDEMDKSKEDSAETVRIASGMKLLEQQLRDIVAPPPKAAFLPSSFSSRNEDTKTKQEHAQVDGSQLQECPPGGRLPPLAWDVYVPGVTFQRSRPGLPSFFVLVTHYAAARAPAQHDGGGNDGGGNEPSSSFLSFSQMQALALASRPVPIKIATVSDSGTVVVFGVCSPTSMSTLNSVGGDDDAHTLVPSIAGMGNSTTTSAAVAAAAMDTENNTEKAAPAP